MLQSSPASQLEYVAVHVRRTDYIGYYVQKRNITPVDADFYTRAMKEMEERLSPRRVIFVLTSDDLAWCRQNLHAPNLIIAGNGKIRSPGLDLALLSSCNHTIFAYGTYGLTAAMYNSQGLTITYNNSREFNSTSAMHFGSSLPNWILL